VKDGANGVLPFISQIVSSVAWPITVLVCAIILRRYLLALIPLIRKVKYSDVEISFGKEVAELAKSAEMSALPNQSADDGSDQWEDLIKVAGVRPRTAIRQAFMRVVDSITDCARKKKVEIADGAYGMPMVIGAVLLGSGAISTAQYDLLSKLRELLEEAENAPPDSISTESAAEFINLAWGLASSVDQQ
jgi:hypothetical protein